jgi:hypothetical protein
VSDEDVMLLASASAGAHWMDSAHIERFAAMVWNEAIEKAASIAEYRSHPTYGECANAIRELKK